MIKLLFIGDIVGREAVKFVSNKIAYLKRSHKIDIAIANAENADDCGYGLSSFACQSLFNAGIDVITSGNHAWDNPSITSYMRENLKIICPANMVDVPLKQSFCFITLRNYKILVANLLGSKNMTCKTTPLLDSILPIIKQNPLGKGRMNGIIIDMHGACHIEKKSLAYVLDGKVSCILGTHTHIPTLDFTILPQGTGFQSDVGMVGSYASLGGFDPKEALPFLSGIRRETWKPVETNITMYATLIDICPETGLCKKISIIRVSENNVRKFSAGDF